MMRWQLWVAVILTILAAVLSLLFGREPGLPAWGLGALWVVVLIAWVTAK